MLVSPARSAMSTSITSRRLGDVCCASLQERRLRLRDFHRDGLFAWSYFSGKGTAGTCLKYIEQAMVELGATAPEAGGFHCVAACDSDESCQQILLGHGVDKDGEFEPTYHHVFRSIQEHADGRTQQFLVSCRPEASDPPEQRVRCYEAMKEHLHEFGGSIFKGGSAWCKRHSGFCPTFQTTLPLSGPRAVDPCVDLTKDRGPAI